MTTVVTFRGVSFELPDGRALLRELSFSLDDGLTALVGPNGVGKTTLARLMTGELSPTRGTIQASAPLLRFPQREPPPDFTVGELLLDSAVWSRQGTALLEGLDLGAPCTRLSGGEWMRVRLARALAGGFLVLDEPTNDLDAEGRRLVRDFLRQRPGGALVISHDRACLALCSRVLELSNLGIAGYRLGWEAYEEAKRHARTTAAEDLERARHAREDARAEAAEQSARQQKRNARGARMAARGGLPKILLGARKSRAEATTGQVDVTGLAKLNDAVRAAHEAHAAQVREPVMYPDVTSDALPAGKLVAEAVAFNVRFRGAETWLYPADLTFGWHGSARVALQGPNGCGKSTLLRALRRAEDLETRGALRTGDLRSLTLDQKLSRLTDDATVFENARATSRLTDGELRTGLARFLFAGETVHQRVASLSGGERLRAALACGFLAADKPELMILDEPTNNLDLPNIAFLEGLVRAFRGGILVVSHDERFLEACELTTTWTLRGRSG